VPLQVQSPPAFGRDGRFTVRVRFDDVVFDGLPLVCTIALPAGAAPSFSGIVKRVAGSEIREVLIDEIGVPAPPHEVPMPQVAFAILTK